MGKERKSSKKKKVQNKPKNGAAPTNVDARTVMELDRFSTKIIDGH